MTHSDPHAQVLPVGNFELKRVESAIRFGYYLSLWETDLLETLKRASRIKALSPKQLVLLEDIEAKLVEAVAGYIPGQEN